MWWLLAGLLGGGRSASLLTPMLMLLLVGVVLELLGVAVFTPVMDLLVGALDWALGELEAVVTDWLNPL